MPTFWIYPPQTPLKSTKKQDLYHDVSEYSIPWKILTQSLYQNFFKFNNKEIELLSGHQSWVRS